MNNQIELKNFITNLLGERLIDYYKTQRKDYSTSGRMYFPQSIVEKNNEKYYDTFNGLRKIKDILELMQKFKSPENIDKIEMYPVGKWMGSTKCRCCGDNLGNGSGYAVFSDGEENLSFSLTGGADHYIKHGIDLNLISYLFINKEKKIKAHIIFIGEISDIKKINEYIFTLDNVIKNEMVTTNKLKIK